VKQFVTHARLVNRKQLGGQACLQAVSAEGSRRYSDECRYCPEEQVLRMHM